MTHDSERSAKEEAEPSLFESVGLTCMRASVVALIVGGGEAYALKRILGFSVSGMPSAMTGLFVPFAFLMLPLGYALERIRTRWFSKTHRMTFAVVAFSLILLLGLRKIASRFGYFPAAVVGETYFAMLAAWGAFAIQLSNSMRKVAATFGLLLALVTQLHASRWVEAHRALAGAIAQETFVPRVMLKVVLRRIS